MISQNRETGQEKVSDSRVPIETRPDRLLFHTIAIEPARWSSRRVSQSLLDMIPKVAESGFSRLEIFEPHLRDKDSGGLIRSELEKHRLKPVILSSYLDLGPSCAAGYDYGRQINEVTEMVQFFGFRKVRVFPGPGIKPGDERSFDILASRLILLGRNLGKDIEILLETHDGSIADDPQRVIDLLNATALPKAGLLYQPTMFNHELAMRQMEVQKPFIRHIHLQNRHPDLSFARLENGIIKWGAILSQLPESMEMTLEFVPRGICSEGGFDLAAVMEEALTERIFIERITKENARAQDFTEF